MRSAESSSPHEPFAESKEFRRHAVNRVPHGHPPSRLAQHSVRLQIVQDLQRQPHPLVEIRVIAQQTVDVVSDGAVGKEIPE